MANLANEQVTPETLFLAGGIAKTHTAAAVSLLVDDSKNFPGIQWDTHLRDLIFEDLVLSDPYIQQHITIEDALSHRSGMPEHGFAQGNDSSTEEELVARLRYLPMSSEIRTKYRYSNLMYVLLSYTFRTVTGWTLEQFLRTRIWEPSGMTSTYFSANDAQKAVKAGKAHLAKGCKWTEQAGFDEQSYTELQQISSAVGLVTNAIDSAK